MPAKPKPKPADQPVNVRLPRDLHQALLDRAAQEDRTMAATIREACRHYLANTTPLTGGQT